MEPETRALRASGAKVGLSTASVYPESTAVAFELAAKLGYDGIEIMVWTDPVSQDAYALERLSQHYQVPILAIHAPCLIITQRVWDDRPVDEVAEGAVRRRAARRGHRRRPPAVPLAARLRPQLPPRHPGHGAGDRRPVRGGEHVPAAGARA